jgi:hypothetical protein
MQVGYVAFGPHYLLNPRVGGWKKQKRKLLVFAMAMHFGPPKEQAKSSIADVVCLSALGKMWSPRYYVAEKYKG